MLTLITAAWLATRREYSASTQTPLTASDAPIAMADGKGPSLPTRKEMSAGDGAALSPAA